MLGRSVVCTGVYRRSVLPPWALRCSRTDHLACPSSLPKVYQTCLAAPPSPPLNRPTGEGSAHHVVSQRDIVFGMLLIIMSQCVQAAQLTFEDHFMVCGVGGQGFSCCWVR